MAEENEKVVEEEVAAEEAQAEAAATQGQTEEKVVYAYTIYRYAGGNTRVENVANDDYAKLTTKEILNDIIAVSKQAKDAQQDELIKKAVYNAFNDYMKAAENQKKAEEVEAQVEAEPAEKKD